MNGSIEGARLGGREMRIRSTLKWLVAIAALSTGCDSRAPRAPEASIARTSAALPQTATSASCAARLVSGDSVGPIHIGMALDALRRACPIVRDTTVPAAYGPPERHVSALLGGDTAVVTMQIGRVAEILLTSGAFHTA